MKGQASSKKLEDLGEPEILGVDFWSGKGCAKRTFMKWNGVVLFFSTWGIPTGKTERYRTYTFSKDAAGKINCSVFLNFDFVEMQRYSYLCFRTWVKKTVALL